MQPINTNSVLLSVGNDCVIFDAWGSSSDWEKLLSERKLNLTAIYSTHGHSDHISAAPELAQKFNIPWYLNHNDLPLISWGNELLKYFQLPEIVDYKSPENITAGFYEILGLPVQIIELPGHSLGGIGFYFESEKILIIGDTVFSDSIGRYDLPGGNLQTLKNSIGKIYNMNLPNDTIVVSGHGTPTTIGKLKTENYYFKS